MKKLILLGLALMSASLSFGQKNRNKAEVFIQVDDPGMYTVYLDNEFVGSENGRFRFYDVYNSAPLLSIIQGNTVIFKKKLNVQAEQRLVLSFTKRGGLNITKQLNLFRNRQYAVNDFDNYTDAFNTGIVPPSIGNEYSRVLSPEAFQQLNEMIRKEAFDDPKIKIIMATTKNTFFTTQQVGVFLKQFTFEDKKLEAAKALYKNTVDPQNYFTLAEVFNFPSNKNTFLDFLNK